MTELTDGIFYIGIEDTDGAAKSDFYFGNKRASACNAYIVKDEKTALIDSVNEAFVEDYLKKAEAITPISNIDYLICNYTGNEYAEGIKRILSLNPNIEIVGTVAAIKHIKEMVNIPFNEHIAKNGGELDIGGGKVLKFIMAPNLPWPDTMLTYVPHDKLLFSGRMFSSYSINYNKEAINEYYNSVLSAFKPFVHKAAEKISTLDIDIICTANGPVIKNEACKCVSEYLDWSKEEKKDKKKAVIVYPNSYGSTALMTGFIEDRLKKYGFEISGYSLKENYNQAAQEVNDADVIVFGTNTVNKNASKEVLNLIAQMNILKSKGKHCFVFGSYGWGGEGLQLMHEYLKLLKLKVFEKPFGVWFNPSQEDYERLGAYIERFVKTIKKDG